MNRIAQICMTSRLVTELKQHQGRAEKWGTTYLAAAAGKASITPIALSMRFNALCDRLGISGLTLHDLRRTQANNVYDRTRDLRCVQAALAHRNLRSTLHYLDRPATVTVDMLELPSAVPKEEIH
jgi:integrase